MRGYAYFNLIFFTGEPDEYTIYIDFTLQSRLKRMTARVKVRDCRQGEIEIIGNWSNDFRCEKCPPKTFSINPKKQCENCPEHAECDGKTVVPSAGYWHASPLSAKIYECLSCEACEYDDRMEKLRNESIDFGSVLNYTQGYSLCHKVRKFREGRDVGTALN